MAKKERAELKKGQAIFTVVGNAKINDYTFKMDSESQNSDWVYNQIKLGVDTLKDGVVFSEAMGGYGSNRNNVVYVHGKKTNDAGKEVDDYSAQWTIDWDDRLNEEMYEEVGENCFFTVGLEKDAKGKTYYKKFLTQYDMIEYIKEHLEDGMTVRVQGKINYSEYDGTTQYKKELTSVVLSQATEDKFGATFTQTILVDKDSVGKLDKDSNSYLVDAYVVDYVGKPKIDGNQVEIKKNCVFPKQFELEHKDDEKTPKLIKKLFSPKKDGVTEITVEGRISKGANTVTATVDDLPEDIQELIDLGVLTEQEAIEKCVGKGSTKERFIIERPRIKKVEKDGVTTPIIEMDEAKYTTEDYVTYEQLLSNAGVAKEEEIPESDDDEEFDLDALLDEE